MTIGASVFLIAGGAILYFATDFRVAQVSVDTVGVILMLAGIVGLFAGLLQETIWSRRARREVRVEDYRDPRDRPLR